MKMKPVDPAAVIRDPHTKQPLPAEGGDVPDDGTFWTRRWLDGETWRLDGTEWVRRLPSGELERKPYVAPTPETEAPATSSSAPLLNAPIAPLTTR